MASHPPDCPQYCCSQFANLADDRHADHPLPDLTNEIHPLFSQTKFPGISNEGYLLLELTLKLASRMLEDDRTVEYVTTMADGSIHTDHDIDSAPGPECSFADIDASETVDGVALRTTRLLRYPRTPAESSKRMSTARVWVTESMRQRSKEILHNLAELLERYDLADGFSDGRMDTTDGIPSITARKNFPRARMAKITLSQTIVWRFVNNYPRIDDPLSLAEQYMVARSFIHEIAHMFAQAVNGERREEVYFRNCALAEAGFDLENALFGGIVAPHSLKDFLEHPKPVTSQVLVDEKYPAGRFGKKYSELGVEVGQRAPLDEFSVVSRVPWMFITSLFTDRFWEEDVPRMGSGPIRPAKRYSWVVKKVSLGESYVNSKGDQLVAEDHLILTCNPFDQGLPARVQNVLRDILRSCRRTALHVK